MGRSIRLRAVDNFPITGVPVGHFPELVRALVLVKQAAARANRRLGHLPAAKAEAIDRACDLIAKEGRYHDQFVVDAIQGGAGTSTNMNTNEVIANVALELMGRPKGDYAALHPNDDVNMAQSTNDAYPTALRLAIIFAAAPLIDSLDELAFAFKSKAVEFGDVLKIGRTQLAGCGADDARPGVRRLLRHHQGRRRASERGRGAVSRSQSRRHRDRHRHQCRSPLCRACRRGTGRGPRASRWCRPANLIEATSDMGAFVLFSGVLKRVAVKLSKICNDLRLLSSGPRAGFGEIRLPTVQAGSSIMPGKVNPVIPEVVNQVAYHGDRPRPDRDDVRRGRSAPAQRIRADHRLLRVVLASYPDGCGRYAGQEAASWASRPIGRRCRALVEDSIGLVTALVPTLGYETCSRVAKQALAQNRKVADIVLEEKLLTQEQMSRLLRPDAMTAPARSI